MTSKSHQSGRTLLQHAASCL